MTVRRHAALAAAAILCLSSFAEAQKPAEKASPRSNPFERIFEYTLFNQTLPDGKHPVWVYYQGKEMLVRVVMPSLEMCVVTPRSEADLGVIKSGNYDVIPKEQWDMPMQIWQAAFQRDLLVHDRLQLC
jgi:hypothetical protein